MAFCTLCSFSKDLSAITSKNVLEAVAFLKSCCESELPIDARICIYCNTNVDVITTIKEKYERGVPGVKEEPFEEQPRWEKETESNHICQLCEQKFNTCSEVQLHVFRAHANINDENFYAAPPDESLNNDEFDSPSNEPDVNADDLDCFVPDISLNEVRSDDKHPKSKPSPKVPETDEFLLTPKLEENEIEPLKGTWQSADKNEVNDEYETKFSHGVVRKLRTSQANNQRSRAKQQVVSDNESDGDDDPSDETYAPRSRKRRQTTPRNKVLTKKNAVQSISRNFGKAERQRQIISEVLTCIACPMSTKSSELASHMKIHHPEIDPTTECDTCDDLFFSKAHLAWHQANESPKRVSFICPVCEAAFIKKTEFIDHVKVIHFMKDESDEINVLSDKQRANFCCGQFWLKEDYQKHLGDTVTPGKSIAKENKDTFKEDAEKEENSAQDTLNLTNLQGPDKCLSDSSKAPPSSHMERKTKLCDKSASEKTIPRRLHGSDLICPHCKKTFKQFNALIRCYNSNKLASTRLKSEQCTICNKRTGNLEEHFARKHSELAGNYCFKCDKEVENISEHMSKLHFGLYDRHFSCGKCGSKHKTEQHLQIHMKKKHSDKKDSMTTCEVCGKTMLVASLRNHMIVHSDKDNFQCKICGKTFKGYSPHYNHMKYAHSKIKYYKCNTCHAKFESAADLNDHFKVMHNNQKKHQCHLCPLSFNYRSRLNAHVAQVHFKEKNKVCDICGQRFGHGSTLLKHKRTHERKGEVGSQSLMMPFGVQNESSE